MMCKSTMLLALSCMVKRQMVPCVAMAKAVVAILIQPLLGGERGPDSRGELCQAHWTEKVGKYTVQLGGQGGDGLHHLRQYL